MHEANMQEAFYNPNHKVSKLQFKFATKILVSNIYQRRQFFVSCFNQCYLLGFMFYSLVLPSFPMMVEDSFCKSKLTFWNNLCFSRGNTVVGWYSLISKNYTGQVDKRCLRHWELEYTLGDVNK